MTLSKLIGIILDDLIYRGIRRRKTQKEKIQFYNKACHSLDMSPFYMSIKNINSKTGTALGLEYKNRSYKLVNKKLPKVIHNRSLPASKKYNAKLSRLHNECFLYNRMTRYTKLYIHRLLAQSPALLPYLPQTMRLSKSSLHHMMQKYNGLYLKPINSSVGNGIIRLSQSKGQQWEIKTTRRTLLVTKKNVYSTLALLIKNRRYLIQQEIPLAKYNGRPYDIRVSVQRADGGEWKVTGMVGKVAGKGKHITNVAKGGKVITCDRLFEYCGFKKMLPLQIEKLSLELAKYLGTRLTNLADVGFDIGVDYKENLYFIEMNGRDLRYSFRDGKMYSTWYATYENPMRYGKYLLSLGASKPNVSR
jgi:glutathione synthase/RimK-type ligase-like ATP-grasp enzyme